MVILFCMYGICSWQDELIEGLMYWYSMTNKNGNYKDCFNQKLPFCTLHRYISGHRPQVDLFAIN